MSLEIKNTLELIEKQIGLKLNLCTDFTGIQNHNNKNYFNIILNSPVSESKEYDMLINISKKINIRVEPNGYKRIAIFIN